MYYMASYMSRRYAETLAVRSSSIHFEKSVYGTIQYMKNCSTNLLMFLAEK